MSTLTTDNKWLKADLLATDGIMLLGMATNTLLENATHVIWGTEQIEKQITGSN